MLVAFYFTTFSVNFLRDAAAGRALLPLVVAVLLVLWMSVEYYYGSPFFQSGLVEPSAVWRGLFAFFVYPYFGYLLADYVWWRLTQVTLFCPVLSVLGLAALGLGIYLRLSSLVSLLRVVSNKARVVAPSRAGTGPVAVPERQLVNLPLQRVCRQPRYLGTFFQLLGAAMALCSWGGILGLFLIGLPMILVQAAREDRSLHNICRSEFASYSKKVPLFWPGFGGLRHKSE